MIEEFAKQLIQNYKLRKDQPFLMACSGGVDSIVLTHLLHRLGYTFALAYCNFKLRVPDCDNEADFVQSIGAKWNKTVHVKSFNTIAFAKNAKVSIQMAARTLRYQWFDQLLEEEHYSTLVTAHHADDHIETLLLRLGRGNGPSGLTGIAAETLNRVRPLLSFSKREILEYAEFEKLQWCEDSSNATSDYLRNAIRNEVLPAWEQHQPQLRKNLLQSLQYIKQAESVLEAEIDRFKSEFLREENGVYHLSVSSLKNTVDPSFYLHRIFYPYGFEHIADLVQLLTAASGKHLLSKTHRLLKNRDELILSVYPEIRKEEYFWDGISPLNTPLTLNASQNENSNTHLTLDREKLIFPLKLRKMKEGDYFYPSGMQGKKKLSKFFKDEKYSLLEKENQWLLCSGEEIVWVVGKRADRRFHASAETKQLFCIQIK